VALEKVDSRLAHLKGELRAVIKAERKGKDVFSDLLALVKQDCEGALRRRDALTRDLTRLLEEHTIAEQRERAAAKVAERLAVEEAIAVFRQDTAALVRVVQSALVPLQEKADALEGRFRHLASRWVSLPAGRARLRPAAPSHVLAGLNTLLDLLAD